MKDKSIKITNRITKTPPSPPDPKIVKLQNKNLHLEANLIKAEVKNLKLEKKMLAIQAENEKLKRDIKAGHGLTDSQIRDMLNHI